MPRQGMIAPDTRFRPLSLQTILLSIFFGILLLSQLFFASFATYLIISRITTSEMNLLDRSITIHWQEYRHFFSKEEQVLRIMADEPRTADLLAGSLPGEEAVLPPLGEGGFRLLIDRYGKLAASDFKATGSGQALITLLGKAWARGETMHSWKLLSMEDCRELLPPSLLQKAEIHWTPKGSAQPQEFPFVLVQIAAVPVFDRNRLLGCLAGVKIINNDKTTHALYRDLLPESFYSIVVNGIRISTNLKTDEQFDLVGEEAAPELTKHHLEKRYTGQSHMSTRKVHLIVADPILNDEGTGIGFLVIGIPADTVNGAMKDTLLLLLFLLLLCLAFSALVITRMARLVTRPVTSLSNLAKDIGQREVITEEHLARLEQQPASFTVETHLLLQGFHGMAGRLFQKNLELQEINATLENRIQGRTLALRNAVKNLRLLSTKKSQVIANLSHELRTPLTSVIGFSEMLADELFGKLNQTQKEYVNIIQNSAKHLLELINDLLDLNSIERDKLELYRQPVYMEDIIIPMIKTVQIQADNKGLSLCCRKVEKLLLSLDPLRIRQVLYNIVTNAIKFTPQGGTVDILVFREDPWAVISVQDTGIGVADEDQKHIFDEFYQCGDLYKRKFEGIGVGLSLSRKLTRMHGGDIEFISKLGVGTMVRILLPLDSASVPSEGGWPDDG